MRIAVLGDIHSNVAALEAVLADAETGACDLFLHTGGVIGYGARPNETIDLLRARGIAGVRGHFDEDVAWADAGTVGTRHGERAADGAPLRADAIGGSLAWNARTLGYTQRQFLKDLPFSIQRDVGERRVLLFHASPIDLRQGIDEQASDAWLEELAEGTGAHVHLFGHTHRPFHRVAGGAHFVNAGSVGRSQDGDTRACAAIVDIGRGVEVTFRRVAFDIEKTVKEIVAAGLGAAAGARA